MKSLFLAVLLPLALLAQNPGPDTEAARLAASCGAFKVVDCAATLFTDNPFHIAVGSLAPGNGFAAGPALSFTHHTIPKNTEAADGKTSSSWRLAWDMDAVASSNASWRAGAYLTAYYTVERPVHVVEGGPPKHSDLRPSSWLMHAYVENDELKKLSLYDSGPFSPRSSLAIYRMNETVAGGNIITPSATLLHLTGFAEANVRAIRLVAASQPYAQFAEGVRIEPSVQRLAFDYSAKLREFAAPGAPHSFQQLNLDLSHTYQLRGTTKLPITFNGPDSCAISSNTNKCPKAGKIGNPEGSLAFRFLLTESFTSGSNTVPFYFQPTMGGGNINGDNSLPSFADYRFRAPNLMLLRGSFEHSLGKWPVGVEFLADAGKVSLTHDVASGPWVHSLAAGFTLRAGGFPALSLLFAWGGGEGTHTLAQVNNALLGGGSRPSLQ